MFPATVSITHKIELKIVCYHGIQWKAKNFSLMILEKSNNRTNYFRTTIYLKLSLSILDDE